MKRAPFTYGVDGSGVRHWRSLDEFAGSPAFQDALAREFPDGASEADAPTRRNFLQVMGASFALAGLAGCRRPEEKIMPYARAPEQVIPGRPQYYATAFPFMGTAFGLLVESHEGRPTKIEGNPRHPESLGAASVYAQAEILSLYDPDRSDSPSEKGQKRSWEEAASALRGRVAALGAAGGKGLAVVATEHRSPALQAQLDELKRQLPRADVFRFEPASRAPAREGARIALAGHRPLEAVLDVARARVIVAIDSDLLLTEGSPIKQARGFADGRRLDPGADGQYRMNRLYAVESGFSTTGSCADHRLRLQSHDAGQLVLALAHELQAVHHLDLGVEPAVTTPRRVPGVAEFGKFVSAVARDLLRNRGASLVVAGYKQPPAVHALCFAINAALGNVGTTVRFVAPFPAEPAGEVAALTAAMKAGAVDTLILLGGNPVLDMPGDLDFAAALARVPASFHLSSHVDETSSAATWHLPRAHFLEAWGDVRSEDGTLSIVQPLIAPLLGGRSDLEVVELALGGGRKGYEIVRSHAMRERPESVFEPLWRRALHDGIWADSAFAPEPATVDGPALAEALRRYAGEPSGGYEVTFAPDAHAWDGRYANNGWLQEMPDPITKLTWDNAALVAAATAKELGVEDGDLVKVSPREGRAVELPIRVAPGTADGTVQVSLGQGRRRAGRVGAGAGFDCYPMRSSKSPGFVAATIEKTGRKHQLAETQEHYSMEGRPIVREADLTRFRKEPRFADEMVEHPPLLSLFNPHAYEGHKWGMVIDLNACIGCNACMVGCQSENNIPLVGKLGVLKSREMHWIRVDRYYTGDDENDPQAVMQPMTCQQCENAPCEQVCPVGATTHSPEGLNDMAYNRCIGTRYCANNCPYKVRRFNFFNYQKDFETISDLRKLQYNPDVSVRSRGVMEKCTYCVQRINEAKIHVQQQGRDRVHDGEVVTACQQTCPTQAIRFGDLNDKTAQVTAAAASPRDYRVLDELNVRPRTSYLARVRNPNPELT